MASIYPRFAKLRYYFLLISDTIKAMVIFLVIFFVAMFLGQIEFTAKNIALLLTLNYEPKGLFDSIAQIVIMFLELSPIMAFVDSKTSSEEKKNELKAKVLRNHIILVGCGHLGRRIAEFLLKFGIPFVILVLPRDRYRNEAILNFHRLGIPIILGDATHEDVLRRANVEKAKAIIVSLDNDVTNSVIAEKAKKLNPNIRTVVRIFNDDLAEVLKDNPSFDEIISTTSLSYYFFAFGAIFDVIPEELLLTIRPPKIFVGLKVEEIERFGIELVAIKRDGRWIKFDKSTRISEQDIIVLVGSRENLARFMKDMFFRV